METKYNDLKLLETELNKDSQNYVITKSEIYNYLMDIGIFYSLNTALNKLKKTEKLLYSSYLSYINPVFTSTNHSSSSNADLMSNIHYLMFRFLQEKSYGRIRSTKAEELSYYSDNNNPSFSWKIPFVFMPFLITYIISCSTRKGTSLTPVIFFDNMKKYFPRVLDHSQKYISEKLSGNMISIFNQWTENYLGKSFFLNLCVLLSKFQDVSHKMSVYNGIQPIINLLMFAPLSPNPIPFYANLILENYCKNIYEQDKDKLFPHLIPWQINGEPEFICSLTREIIYKTELIRDTLPVLLKKHHTDGSIYELAVDNYEDFMNDLSSIYNDIHKLDSDTIKNKLWDFFNLSNTNKTVVSAVFCNSLSISISNEEKHVEKFTEILSGYIDDIISEVDKFMKLVKQTSSSHPEKYKKTNTKQDNYDSLKIYINRKKEACITNITEHIQKLPAPFYYHDNGLINQNGFSSTFFSEHDILKILAIIIPEEKSGAPEYMQKLIQTQKISFPLSPTELVYFLLSINTP